MDLSKSQSGQDFTTLASEILGKNVDETSPHPANNGRGGGGGEGGRGRDSGVYKAEFLRWWEKKGRQEKQNAESLSDDDVTMASDSESGYEEENAIETIKKRLAEVGGMVASRRPRVAENAVDRMSTPLQSQVQRLTAVTPQTYRKFRQRERGIKSHAIQRFRYASAMVLIVVRICRAGKKYLQQDANANSPSSVSPADESLKSTNRETEINRLNSVSSMKTSIGWDLQMNLTTQPQYRTASQLKRILYMIRANKAFTIFPSDSETELARRLAYERYDDGRVIGYQGKPPDRFYYIVSGRVNLVREYDLQTGTMTKTLGFLNKGKFSDTEELEKQWNRQSSLICCGPVEVLLLDKEDFFHLHNTHAGPPIEFLRSQYLFWEFPCHLFSQHPEAIDYKFYGPGRLVAKDSNNTKWMYVIKSGRCKCIRRQFVADVKSDQKFSQKKAIDKLGYTKQPSHADAMIGAGIKRIVLGGKVRIDPVGQAEEISMIGSPHVGTLGIRINEIPATPWIHDPLTSPLHLRSTKVTLPELDSSHVKARRRNQCENGFTLQDALFVKDFAANYCLQTPQSNRSLSHESSPSLPRLPAALPPSARGTDDYLMSERDRPKRKFTLLETGALAPSTQRRAYVQLDGMSAGDLFGLNDVAGTASSAPSGVSVVSEGAEIIKINKRFFKTHAGVVTMLKLDTLVRQFMSEEDASANLERQEVWTRYKTTLMERLAQRNYQTGTRWKRSLKPLSFST